MGKFGPMEPSLRSATGFFICRIRGNQLHFLISSKVSRICRDWTAHTMVRMIYQLQYASWDRAKLIGECFSFQPVLHDWCNKGCGMYYPVCGMTHIKEPLLLIGKSSPCGSSRFPLSLSEWSFTICLMPYNRK